jgi:hypothetical protein
MLLQWIDHFPEVVSTEFQQDYPVCRLIATTDENVLQMYFPVGTMTEELRDRGVIEYDPVNGLAHLKANEPPPSPVTPGL